MFIMVEGTDGSGKGTQTQLLFDRLKQEGYDVEQISFPQYGERSCTMVEDYLNGKFGSADEVGPYPASIFYATDRFAAAPKIRAWLDEGKIVIANRYVASNMGHQGGKIDDPEERKKYFDWNYHLEYTIFNIPKPTVNVILHMPAEMAQALVDKKDARTYLNGKKRDIHEDNIDHLKKAEQAYLDIAKRYPDFTLLECTDGDILLAPKVIHEKLWDLLSSRIEHPPTT